MRIRLIRIGNSRGLRLPKPLIQQAGLGDDIEVQLEEGRIVISPCGAPRAGWREAARQGHERGEDRPLLAGADTRFDDLDWQWE